MRAGISSENSSSRRSGIESNLVAALQRDDLSTNRHPATSSTSTGSSCPFFGSPLIDCPSPLRRQPGLAARLGQFAHAQDIALALGHRYHAARVEQVEDV